MLRHSLAVCLIGLLAGLCSTTGVLTPIRNCLNEIRFDISPRLPSGEIVLVDIDAKSIASVGTWPWQRRIHADLVRKLVRLGASEIAFDIDFSARSNDFDDAEFAAALAEAHDSVILAAFNQRQTASPDDPAIVANRPTEPLRQHAWLASVNLRTDLDGRVRRYAFGEHVAGEDIPSLPTMYGRASAKAGTFAIDFSIAGRAIERVPAIDVLEGRGGDKVAGKRVIVGATAIELRDYFQVPSQGFLSGALVQALAAETLLQDRALREPGLLFTVFGLILLTLLVVAAKRIEWKLRLIGISCAAMLIEICATVLQASAAISVDTSAFHVMLLGAVALTFGREIGLRRVLVAISRAEARNTRTLLDQVIADNFDGIVVVDQSGIIHSVSRSALQMFRPAEPTDWNGRDLAEFVPAGFADAMMQAIGAARRGDSVEQSTRELSLDLPGTGRRILEYVITPSRLSGGVSPGGRGRADHFAACLTFRDITERRLAEKRLAYLARFDAMTGLPNRNAFIDRLSAAIADAPVNEPIAVLYCDLDRFKSVNDSFGHGIGDLLLRAVAERGVRIVLTPNVLARFGGDEFAIIWVGSTDEERLKDFACDLIRVLSEPYEISGHRLAVGASVGIAIASDCESDVTALMRNADIALYTAKRDGGGSYRFFDASMSVALQARQKLEIDLRDALARDEFAVYYQPQFDLRTRELTGVEALLRWRHPERGFVSPAEFIPVAEEVGLMGALGEWVLRKACSDVARWPRVIKLAVNVSPVQFVRDNIVEAVDRALNLAKLPPGQLELEITESLFIQENSVIRSIMDELHGRGIRFALDDFGTGYSSLSYIRKFPIGKIKVDRSFVSGIPHDQEAVAIVQAVIALATSLGIRINAEGLETDEQILLLRAMGCDEGQGFGLGRPQTSGEIMRLLSNGLQDAG